MNMPSNLDLKFKWRYESDCGDVLRILQVLTKYKQTTMESLATNSLFLPHLYKLGSFKPNQTLLVTNFILIWFLNDPTKTSPLWKRKEKPKSRRELFAFSPIHLQLGYNYLVTLKL